MAENLAAFYAAFAAVAGMLIGSFLNVCIYRLPRDLSVVAPRSFCPGCRRQLAWFDNVPVLSYVFLRGKCRSCGQAIPWRYATVEVVTGALFGIVVWRYGWNLAALKWCLLEALLVGLFWTDLEERLLPDEFTLGGAGAGLLFAAFVPVPGSLTPLLFAGVRMPWQGLIASFAGALLLAVPIWVLGTVWGRVRHVEALGFGDVKLLALIGSFLGVEAGLPALMVGAVSGLTIGIVYVAATGKSFRTYQLPFGSFLCLGAAAIPIFSRL